MTVPGSSGEMSARRGVAKRSEPAALVDDQAPEVGSPRSARRNPAIDGARGLAVLLMIADHVMVVAGAPGALRLVTRAGFPLFMVPSGAVWHGWNRGRLLEVAAAALVAEWLGGMVGLLAPGVLVVWLLAQLAMPLVARWPVAMLTAGLLLAVNVPIWDGYHPGLMVAYLALGRLVNSWPDRLGHPWLAALGRRPLTLYLGHLAVLAGVVALLGR